MAESVDGNPQGPNVFNVLCCFIKGTLIVWDFGVTGCHGMTVVGIQLNNLPKEWMLFFSPNMEFEAKHMLGREFVKIYLAV